MSDEMSIKSKTIRRLEVGEAGPFKRGLHRLLRESRPYMGSTWLMEGRFLVVVCVSGFS